MQVYTCYFKTNAKRIADFSNLLGFVRDVYSIEAVGSTTNIVIKTHYFTSHPLLNHFGTATLAFFSWTVPRVVASSPPAAAAAAAPACAMEHAVCVTPSCHTHAR